MLEVYTRNFILVITGEWTEMLGVEGFICYLIFLSVVELFFFFIMTVLLLFKNKKLVRKTSSLWMVMRKVCPKRTAPLSYTSAGTPSGLVECAKPEQSKVGRDEVSWRSWRNWRHTFPSLCGSWLCLLSVCQPNQITFRLYPMRWG